jgi:hypothetical protein
MKPKELTGSVRIFLWNLLGEIFRIINIKELLGEDYKGDKLFDIQGVKLKTGPD